MKNQRYTRAFLFALTLCIATPVWPNNPVPAQQKVASEKGNQSSKNLKKYGYFFHLGIDAANLAVEKGPEHVIPVFGQQAAQELVFASLMRSCPLHSSYQRGLAGSAINSTFAGIKFWSYLQKSNLSFREKLALTCKYSSALFMKSMVVGLAYHGLIRAANSGLSSCGSPYRLGEYPQWITNNGLLSLLAMELPGMSKGMLGSLYDHFVYGTQQVKEKGERA